MMARTAGTALPRYREPPAGALPCLLMLGLLVAASAPGAAVELRNGTLTSGGGAATSPSYATSTALGQSTAGGEAESEHYGISEGVLRPEPEPAQTTPGDLTGDGAVDGSDFSRFLATFGRCEGQAGYLADADYDGDQCITFVDYQTWYGYYLGR